jgi:hypothetical protein
MRPPTATSASAQGEAAMRSPALARTALACLGAYCLFFGLVAVPFPHTFYEHFPFVRDWVADFPPYNEHLISDLGGLYLGFAVIFALAAYRLERGTIVAACAGFLTVSSLHLLFHATHLHGMAPADAAAELFALATLLAPPLIALWASCDETPTD